MSSPGSPMTESEKEYHEREKNQKRFGVRELTPHITTAVACELSRILSGDQIACLSNMARKWISHHETEDYERKVQLSRAQRLERHRHKGEPKR